jgi:hypothetical protein
MAAACGPGVHMPAMADSSPQPHPDAPIGPGGPDADTSCATAMYQAQQTPTAMLVVLDRSPSMANSNKWVFAAQAIVQALDQDVFDSLYVGLYASPTPATEPIPAMCGLIAGLPVECESPPFPQVDLTLAGAMKSTGASGPRHDIKQWLSTNFPVMDMVGADPSPLYDGLQAAIADLQGWPMTGNRVLFVVTDGSIDCTSFSTRPSIVDANGCPDWEEPNNIVTLLHNAYSDPNKPIHTFIVGVPGADTYDPSAAMYPPYHMKAALSAMAYAGAPDLVSSTCTGTTFMQSSPDPTEPCHFDMTGAFDTATLAANIENVRGSVLGCTFDLPVPPGGAMIDMSKVNVTYTVDGTTVSIGRRADPTNQCQTTGCWDYTADGRVQLIGKACMDITDAMSVAVNIITGCMTHIT